MPADNIFNSDPVRITQSIKHVGKELDREKKEKKEAEPELPEREHDSIELSTEAETVVELQPAITVNEVHHGDTDQSPGINVDVTVG